MNTRRLHIFAGALLLALCPASGAAPEAAPETEQTPAPVVEEAPGLPGADHLERDIALGRFQTRLEQDIQILGRIRKLLETLRQLAPYTGVVDTLFSGAPEEDRLLQALAALQAHFAAQETPAPAAAPPPTPAPALPPPARARAPVLLNFVQPARGGRPGKAILRIGGDYTILYQGEELQLHGISYRLQKIERDAVTLQALEGSRPPLVVHLQ